MRSYPIDSAQAAGRILALSMVADGSLAETEIAALDRSRILEHLDLDQAQFQCLMQELCDDLLATASHGSVQLERDVIDSLLSEIQSPELRRKLLRAMWSVADADEWLADGEAVLLARASIVWAAESNFCSARQRAAALV